MPGSLRYRNPVFLPPAFMTIQLSWPSEPSSLYRSHPGRQSTFQFNAVGDAVTVAEYDFLLSLGDGVAVDDDVRLVE